MLHPAAWDVRHARVVTVIRFFLLLLLLEFYCFIRVTTINNTRSLTHRDVYSVHICLLLHHLFRSTHTMHSIWDPSKSMLLDVYILAKSSKMLIFAEVRWQCRHRRDSSSYTHTQSRSCEKMMTLTATTMAMQEKNVHRAHMKCVTIRTYCVLWLWQTLWNLYRTYAAAAPLLLGILFGVSDVGIFITYDTQK